MCRDISRILGDNIRKTRKEQSLTQENLAEMTGFDISYISRIERGVMNPSLKALSKIAESLGYPISDFFLHKKNDVNKERKDLCISRKDHPSRVFLVTKAMENMRDDETKVALEVIEALSRSFKEIRKSPKGEKR